MSMYPCTQRQTMSTTSSYQGVAVWSHDHSYSVFASCTSRCDYCDTTLWAQIFEQSPFLHVTDRRAFKDYKRLTAEADSSKAMVAINIGGVSNNADYAIFAAGCIGVYCGIPIYDVLPKGKGTIRFHIWESDVDKLICFSKRVDLNPAKEALDTTVPSHFMQATCEGEVFFSTTAREIKQCHAKCNKKTDCPRRTCDISYALSGDERIAERKKKDAELEEKRKKLAAATLIMPSSSAAIRDIFLMKTSVVLEQRRPGGPMATATKAAPTMMITAPSPVDDDEPLATLEGMNVGDEYDEATDGSHPAVVVAPVQC